MLELIATTFGHRSAQGPVQVTSPISLKAVAGTVVALVGPSGIGKSTMLRTIASIIPPLGGKIAVPESAEHARDCWYEPQTPIFLPFRNVIQNALASRELDRPLVQEDLEAAVEILERLGLGASAYLQPRSLSGGMRRRLALAQGLLAERCLLLLDEPLAELDLDTRRKAELVLIETTATDGRIVLIASHDIDSVVAVADTVVVLQAPLPARAVILPIAERFREALRDPSGRRASDRFPSAVAMVQKLLWKQWND